MLYAWHKWWKKHHEREEQYWQVRADLLNQCFDYDSQERAALYAFRAAGHRWKVHYHSNRPKYHF